MNASKLRSKSNKHINLIGCACFFCKKVVGYTMFLYFCGAKENAIGNVYEMLCHGSSICADALWL